MILCSFNILVISVLMYIYLLRWLYDALHGYEVVYLTHSLLIDGFLALNILVPMSRLGYDPLSLRSIA